MLHCEQIPGFSVLAHGESVRQYYCDLRDHVLLGQPLQFQWKLSDWMKDERLWAKHNDSTTLEEYQIFHDCGKPYCIEVDQDGRKHFLNHATVSESIWRTIGGSDKAAVLMGMDMDVHLLKAENLDEFCRREEAADLLITGFCEIHSNALMFGGIESTSFKIKWKHLDRRGRQIVSKLRANCK
jgi:hypothetical protein